MGTRNMTIVTSEKKTKVAQYGQWDGYPTGQGQTIADFLKTVDLAKFKKQINALKLVDQKKVDKFVESIGCKNGFMDNKQAEQYHREFPGLSRDHCAGILQLIHDGEVTEIQLNEDFKNDDVFCEFCYIVDLDKETVSVNDGKEYTFKQWTRGGLMERLEARDD